jgi:arsenate reductase
MAEAFLRDMARERFEVVSAGAHATSLDQEAVAAMNEVGLDISGQRAKTVDPFMRERVAFLITFCDREIEKTCPIFPGAIWRLKWPIDRPALARSREERREMTRRVRDDNPLTSCLTPRVTGASPATATRDLADMVAKGALVRHGERRHARYDVAIPGRTVTPVVVNENGGLDTTP